MIYVNVVWRRPGFTRVVWEPLYYTITFSYAMPVIAAMSGRIWPIMAILYGIQWAFFWFIRHVGCWSITCVRPN
ncbi:hypothetical protein B0T18DRAFT_397713 [Schizothecium vesticola]|uniref:Uncharacterized protein n=1 Tax=Schizothecium vesticola TaxID=314040 RepID=A0AA40F9R1_9PEZI|nr:hypothetical protein B0T18DRAFT_397713 [Schizothecium vesticola]